MKKHLTTFTVLALLATGAFAEAKLTITPPVVTSWTQTIGNNTYTANQTDLDAMNGKVSASFAAIQDSLNTEVFSKMKTFPLLNKGFANANTATWDNASLMGYQNYDLFAVSVGTNLGAVAPISDVLAGKDVLAKVTNDGDLEVGLATGGFVAQGGLNLGFLVPNLYGSAKIGFGSAKVSGSSISQGMFGLGANYSVVKGVDLLFGLLKWRGLNVGSGFVFNGNKVDALVPINDPAPQSFTASAGSSGNITFEASTANIKANLVVESSSLVIPIDLATSIQAFWLFNVGLDVGADLAFSSGGVKLGGSSDLKLKATGADIKTSAGKMSVKADNATAGGDFFNPRVAASLGLNVAMFKLDVPVSYYPLSQAVSVGITGAVVW